MVNTITPDDEYIDESEMLCFLDSEAVRTCHAGYQPSMILFNKTMNSAEFFGIVDWSTDSGKSTMAIIWAITHHQRVIIALPEHSNGTGIIAESRIVILQTNPSILPFLDDFDVLESRDFYCKETSPKDYNNRRFYYVDAKKQIDRLQKEIENHRVEISDKKKQISELRNGDYYTSLCSSIFNDDIERIKALEHAIDTEEKLIKKYERQGFPKDRDYYMQMQYCRIDCEYCHPEKNEDVGIDDYIPEKHVICPYINKILHLKDSGRSFITTHDFMSTPLAPVIINNWNGKLWKKLHDAEHAERDAKAKLNNRKLARPGTKRYEKDQARKTKQDKIRENEEELESRVPHVVIFDENVEVEKIIKIQKIKAKTLDWLNDCLVNFINVIQPSDPTFPDWLKLNAIISAILSKEYKKVERLVLEAHDDKLITRESFETACSFIYQHDITVPRLDIIDALVYIIERALELPDLEACFSFRRGFFVIGHLNFNLRENIVNALKIRFLSATLNNAVISQYFGFTCDLDLPKIDNKFQVYTYKLKKGGVRSLLNEKTGTTPLFDDYYKLAARNVTHGYLPLSICCRIDVGEILMNRLNAEFPSLKIKFINSAADRERIENDWKERRKTDPDADPFPGIDIVIDHYELRSTNLYKSFLYQICFGGPFLDNEDISMLAKIGGFTTEDIYRSVVASIVQANGRVGRKTELKPRKIIWNLCGDEKYPYLNNVQEISLEWDPDHPDDDIDRVECYDESKIIRKIEKAAEKGRFIRYERNMINPVTDRMLKEENPIIETFIARNKSGTRHTFLRLVPSKTEQTWEKYRQKIKVQSPALDQEPLYPDQVREQYVDLTNKKNESEKNDDE